MLDYDLEAAGDVEIMNRAEAEARIVVSDDTDFGTLLALPRRQSPSAILFRRGTDRRPELQLALLLANLGAIQESLEAGALVIFEQSRVRIRRLPFGRL